MNPVEEDDDGGDDYNSLQACGSYSNQCLSVVLWLPHRDVVVSCVHNYDHHHSCHRDHVARFSNCQYFMNHHSYLRCCVHSGASC